MVSLWLKVLSGRVPPGSCPLAQGNSTSAVQDGSKSRISASTTKPSVAARSHQAHGLLLAPGHRSPPVSQWFKGKANNWMRDVLSRDTHLTPNQLTLLLYYCIPEQVPPNFAICPLPLIVSSWVTSLLWSLPLIEVLNKEPARSKTWLGRAGRAGYIPLSYSVTDDISRPSSPRIGLESPSLHSRCPSSSLFRTGLLSSCGGYSH
jgi:hypothetical protein